MFVRIRRIPSRLPFLRRYDRGFLVERWPSGDHNEPVFRTTLSGGRVTEERAEAILAAVAGRQYRDGRDS